jgi:hypothetical protein
MRAMQAERIFNGTATSLRSRRSFGPIGVIGCVARARRG